MTTTRSSLIFAVTSMAFLRRLSMRATRTDLVTLGLQLHLEARSLLTYSTSRSANAPLARSRPE
ncbi:hypothetical protein FHU28_002638 [Micromonospora echinospora]|uniref:Uncharacterized protein n=1 Tax=Micromonospora echinospora TaxID=1877 RepID=A0ABR6MBP1_MICEC|nr:hypothetical protein [Micromonospora echinospora]